jgi:hypothetical protein
MKKLVLVLIVLAALGIAVPQALAKTVTVDKDKVQCPRANFTSIQAAVNAAIPGDTVKVCPDLYTESVTVNKPALTVEGASTADGCTVLTAADPTKDSIVTGGVSFAFNLVNNNILLSGFVVQNSNIAIQTSPSFSGYRITDSIAQNNSTAGVNFNSSGGSQSRVDHNCFRSNLSGLESEVGDLRNALVDHNSTYRNTFAGLDFTGAGARAYVTVTSNSSLEDGAAGVTMDNSTGTSVDHNNARGTPRVAANYGAISIGGGNNGLAVSNNVVDGSGVGNGINFNQNNFVPIFPAPSVGTNVIGNTINRSGGSGIVAIGTATMGSVNLSLFSGNTVSLSGIDGIRIQLSNTNNRIENNQTDKNGRDGIHAEGATNNTFANNSAFLNIEFDARDDNRPANTWTGNHCDTDSPPGTICGVG